MLIYFHADSCITPCTALTHLISEYQRKIPQPTFRIRVGERMEKKSWNRRQKHNGVSSSQRKERWKKPGQYSRISSMICLMMQCYGVTMGQLIFMKRTTWQHSRRASDRRIRPFMVISPPGSVLLHLAFMRMHSGYMTGHCRLFLITLRSGITRPIP